MLLLIISFNFLFKYFIRLFLSPFILRTISNNGKMLVCILKCYISIDRTSHSNARSFESSFLKQKNILFKLSTMLYIFLEKLYGLMGGRKELLGLVKILKQIDYRSLSRRNSKNYSLLRKRTELAR